MIGEQVRIALMSKSKQVRGNASPIFSGRDEDGNQRTDGHCHSHYLCEAASGDGRISHVTVFAPAGFDRDDEIAFSRLREVWGKGGYELQLVLLGVGQPQDFGGLNERSGQSKILAKTNSWRSRTPYIPSRHFKSKSPSGISEELCEMVRLDLRRRPLWADHADDVEMSPLFDRQDAGTNLGGHFTSWLKFRSQRLLGKGKRAHAGGYGFRLTFKEDVTGPIALGYASHFGLGLFEPNSR